MLVAAKKSQTGVSIEMTPMIDVVFLLLTFFLVASSFHQVEREMQIALPVASSSGPISAALRELVVNVDAEGEIIVAGRQLAPDDFRTMVTEAVERNPQKKVTLRGDRATAYANIVNVLDICKACGVQEPYLDTVMH